MSLGQLVLKASREPVLFLPRVEPHQAGRLLALLSFGVGAWAAQASFQGHDLVAWAALGGIMLGMLLNWRWLKKDAGWRVDFTQRRVEPVGLGGQAEPISGEGWSIQVAPGERRTCLAIDLRHADRGRVARLIDVPARGKADTINLNQLADRLATRLDVPRTGPRL